MSSSLPLIGGALVLGVMVAASYTFAVSLSAAASGRLATLRAARLGAYGVVGLICAAMCSLAYALVSHDFALRYVAQYSNRKMPALYLLASLWGGQAGSLLVWLFVLGLYIAACVRSLGRKHVELQPYVIATLMVIVGFFCVLLTFAANPFALAAGGQSARLDGEGLNPLLQTVPMLVHPPCLYLGFVGCSVPFAFAVAALASGRLDAEWVTACKKVTLVALLFLAAGNLAGMAWAYEMLGWGGTWAWDPVQNAALMPLLLLVAFVHSVMLQEKRGTLKLWNVALACLTFVMTIVGTFLNRSGRVPSVHSYAHSSIGNYFLVFLGLVVASVATLVMVRWPELRRATRRPPESVLSRARVFVIGNWSLCGIVLLILAATTFPLVSNFLWNERITLGPPQFDAFMKPLGLAVFFLMGVGMLLPWRKAQRLRERLVAPIAAALLVAALHICFGESLGFPVVGYASALGLSLCAFNLAVIVQDVVVRWRDRRDRRDRRHGGALAHLGIVLVFFGLTGRAWNVDREEGLDPGQTLRVEGLTFEYAGAHTVTDGAKRRIFADVRVSGDRGELGRVSPAKVFYDAMPDVPTTEPSILRSMRRDIYVVVGRIDPLTHRASLQVRVNPLVGWIWLGAIVLVLGIVVSRWSGRERGVTPADAGP